MYACKCEIKLMIRGSSFKKKNACKWQVYADISDNVIIVYLNLKFECMRMISGNALQRVIWKLFIDSKKSKIAS